VITIANQGGSSQAGSAISCAETSCGATSATIAGGIAGGVMYWDKGVRHPKYFALDTKIPWHEVASI